MRGDADLSTLIRALVFELVDQITGQVVAALTSTPAFGGDDPALILYHAAPAYADSVLRWTNAVPASPQETELAGPADSLGLGGKLAFHTDDGAHTALATLYAQFPATTALALLQVAQQAADESVTATTYDPTTGTSSLSVQGAAGVVALDPATKLQMNGRKAALSLYALTVTADATATLLLGAAFANIAGAAVTINLQKNDIALITGAFDFDCTALGAGNPACVGVCNVNGVARPEGALWGTAAVNTRAMASRAWQYTAPAAGAYTFQLSAAKTAGVGTYHALITHTGIGVTVIGTK